MMRGIKMKGTKKFIFLKRKKYIKNNLLFIEYPQKN